VENAVKKVKYIYIFIKKKYILAALHNYYAQFLQLYSLVNHCNSRKCITVDNILNYKCINNSVIPVIYTHHPTPSRVNTVAVLGYLSGCRILLWIIR